MVRVVMSWPPNLPWHVEISATNSKFYMIDQYGDLSFSDGAAKAESGNQFAMVRALFKDAEWSYFMEVDDNGKS